MPQLECVEGRIAWCYAGVLCCGCGCPEVECCGAEDFTCEFGLGEICYRIGGASFCEGIDQGIFDPDCPGETRHPDCPDTFGQTNNITACTSNHPVSCQWDINSVLYCPVGASDYCDWKLCVDFTSDCPDEPGGEDFYAVFTPSYIDLDTGEFWFEEADEFPYTIPLCAESPMEWIRLSICALGTAPTGPPDLSRPSMRIC